MPKKTLLPLCAALLLFPATSSAAPADAGYVNDEGARVIQDGPVRELVIDDGEDIDGELFKAMGEDLSGRPGIIHKNMIGLRTNFLMQLGRLSTDL
jgi:hypothetical protein